MYEEKEGCVYMDENNENKPNTNVEDTNKQNEENVTNANTEVSKEQTSAKKETKESTKNVDIKKEANNAKNFFVRFFKEPLSEMKKIVTKPKSVFKIVLILLIAWVIFECLGSIIGIAKSYTYSPYYTFSMFMRNSISDFFEVFIAILIPVASVAALSFIIYLLMKGKKKNYLIIVTTIIASKIPVVIASLVSLLGYINSQVRVITNSFSDFCFVISTVLVYFAIKALYNEEDDNKAQRTFLIAMAIYFAVILVLRFFNIDIYC